MDPRDAQSSILLARGQASIDELLAAAFGHWPPRGLDIAHANPRLVTLTSSIDTFAPGLSEQQKAKALRSDSGQAMRTGPRRIFINPDADRDTISLTCALAHETAHILQGDHHGLRCFALLGQTGLERSQRRQKPICDMLVSKLIATHGKRGLISRMFNWARDAAYYTKGIEVQARLHESLVTGYQSWARLPGDRSELYFALASLGFEPPLTIKHSMTLHPRNAELRAAFAHTPTRNYAFIRDLKIVESCLTPTGRAQWWEDTLPRLYCDLIEMYGDRAGRTRFGYGVNETHAMRQRYADDLALLKAGDWRLNLTPTGDAAPFALLRTDGFSAPALQRLTSALDNARIGYGQWPKSYAYSDRWLVVRGDDLTALLRLIGPKSPPAPTNKLS